MENMKDMFTTAYTNEDIIDYVRKEHGFQVEVISNEAQEPAESGSFLKEDAVVKTVEKDAIQFNVQISFLGKITGDNYKEVIARKNLNKVFRKSPDLQQLEELGFSYLRFGKDSSVPTFTMELSEDRKLGDEATLQMLYESILILKEWQDQAAEYDVEFEQITIGGLEIDIQSEYKSWRDLGNRLAAKNIKEFTYQFHVQDYEKMEEIEEQLNALDLDGSSLECYVMEVIDECAAYSFTLSKRKETRFEDSRSFRYDDQGDKDDLFQAIQIIRNVNLPIEKVIINKIYTPNDSEKQCKTKQELENQGEYIDFATREVSIENLQEIISVEDIYFEYKH